MIEIMSPAGSQECLSAAIKAGANSVYFGVDQLNMRSKAAKNFKLRDLKNIVKLCAKNNVKTYLTLNTILYDNDQETMKKICNEAKKAKITAIIASDVSAIKYAQSIGQTVHISTQTNVSNLEAVKFYSKYADVIVLARELTLNQIKNIITQIKKQNITGPSGKLIRIEVFAHGALCVSISGKCYMSLGVYNSSANRGKCLQNCRRKYRVIDDETGQELVLDNKYIMSPKDLCTIKFLDKILNAGVQVLKIEGRGRSPEYVYTVTKIYREAADAYLKKRFTKEKTKKWTKELEKVFNRGFWHGGYYLGKKLGEWSGKYGSQATTKKQYLGLTTNYFVKTKIGEFILQNDKLEIGDEILIIGPTTGVIQTKVTTIYKDEKPIKIAKKSDNITIPIPEKIRKRDKLYLVIKQTIYK